MPADRRALFLSLIATATSGCLDFIHNDDLDHQTVKELLARPATFERADVAIVLGCPADDETGEASRCQRCRVKSALRAYREGRVDAVIFSGGAAHNQNVEAETMARLAEARGLPAAAIEREPAALTTWMNVRFSQRIMRRRGWRTALFISTAAHLPRVDRIARHFGIPARYRACDWDLPPDREEEWRGPLRPPPR